MVKVGTLVRYVRMVCDDLRSDASDLSHPLVADENTAHMSPPLLQIAGAEQSLAHHAWRLRAMGEMLIAGL